MENSIDFVFQAAMALPIDERARLVDSLISTFPMQDASPLDESWLAEIERRSDEIDAGTAELIPWEEVRRQVIENPHAND